MTYGVIHHFRGGTEDQIQASIKGGPPARREPAGRAVAARGRPVRGRLDHFAVHD